MRISSSLYTQQRRCVVSCTVILNEEHNQVVVNVTGLVRKVCVWMRRGGGSFQLPLEA